jgi:ABC-type Mn2+/Zn2+ transport system permease subunit
MLDALLDPWRDPLLRRAFAEVVLVGIAGGALGCWIVLGRVSYGAESLAHSLFPGLVGAALLGVPLLLGGAVGIAVAALAVALAARLPRLERDTAVAVVVPTFFGGGVLLALSASAPPGLSGLLFGDVLGVSDGDLALAAALSVVVVGALLLLHEQLLAVGFDRDNARAIGARPLLADVALTGLLALAILVAVQGLGNLLVVAVLVGPAATARLLAPRMGQMMVVAAGIAAASGIVGLYVSYHARTAAGASIVAVIAATHIIVLIATNFAVKPALTV